MSVYFVIFAAIILVEGRHHSPYHRFQYDRRNLDCQCVSFQRCPDSQNEENVAINGHGLLDPRIGNKICANADEICCEFPADKDDSEPDERPEDKELPSKPSSPTKCGYNSLHHLQSRITAPSLSTKFGELPWNLILQEYSGANLKHLYKCGAALIHPKAAITAAHCVSAFVDDPEKIIVRAGEWDTNTRNEPLPYQDSPAEEILVHSNYNPLSLKHDIAIVVLAEAFVLADNVGLICLGRRSRALKANCVTSGWGKDAYQNGRYSTVLRKVQMAIVEREECGKILRGTRLGRLYSLHKSFMCAGGEKDRDACKGDGGSPLICPVVGDEERFVQVGIVSWGIGCGTAGIPGVYVNVELYLEWIDSELSERDLDTSLYKI